MPLMFHSQPPEEPEPRQNIEKTLEELEIELDIDLEQLDENNLDPSVSNLRRLYVKCAIITYMNNHTSMLGSNLTVSVLTGLRR